MVQPTALDIVDGNYITGGSSNFNKYSSAALDKLTKQPALALDDHPRHDILAQVEDQIAQDAPSIFTASLNFILGRDPRLKNFQYNAIYGAYYDRLSKAA